MKSSLTLIGLLGVIFTFCGCSSFIRDWKKAVAVPTGIEGRWEGTWLSSHNGHTGRLRCLLEKQADDRYLARFDSTYKKILHFKSTVVIEGAQSNGTFRFNGDAQLPWWAGGLYHYAGTITPTNFFSTYECKYDRGTFQMSRPGQ